MNFLSLFLDLVLIGLLVYGIRAALVLQKQLKDLRQSRSEMEKFVADFNGTVLRAEAGIKGLKQAAREGGDDLEQLIDRGHSLREELHFLIESADQIANRIASSARADNNKASSAEMSSKENEPKKDLAAGKVTTAKPAPAEMKAKDIADKSTPEKYEHFLRVLDTKEPVRIINAPPPPPLKSKAENELAALLDKNSRENRGNG
jgi:Domain of unknown function (DUF6468)